jgi:hypothetical protein
MSIERLAERVIEQGFHVREPSGASLQVALLYKLLLVVTHVKRLLDVKELAPSPTVP